MDHYHLIIESLRNNKNVPIEACASMLETEKIPHRFGALLAGLRIRPGLFSDPANLESGIYSLFPDLALKIDALCKWDPSWHSKMPNEVVGWKIFADKIADESIPDEIVGFWLMSVVLEGLSDNDVKALTIAMADSGQVFDYRKDFPNDRLVRRYPTGALSEKVALIMPTVISWCRENLKVKVISPYIVARILGHTGGTWDKLLAIPGFRFPSPGEEAVEIMALAGTAYIVTHDQFNPTDRRLYTLRGETDTIKSLPLIVSSIASKMIACPVHLLQLDVRYGGGAFFKDQESAFEASKLIAEACTGNDMKAFATVENANFPTGSSIGSQVEVAEAFEVLGAKQSGLFDPRGIWHQRNIVADFTSRLLSEEFGINQRDIYILIQNGFQSGEFFKPFIKILKLHGVSEQVASKIWDAPTSLLNGMSRSDIIAITSGRLVAINQMALGQHVNERVNGRNIILLKRLFDSVEAGDKIAITYSDLEENQGELNQHFVVS